MLAATEPGDSIQTPTQTIDLVFLYPLLRCCLQATAFRKDAVWSISQVFCSCQCSYTLLYMDLGMVEMSSYAIEVKVPVRVLLCT
jgi:hypothetical protein